MDYKTLKKIFQNFARRDLKSKDETQIDSNSESFRG